jgi:peptidoglycan hydrolase-like amidase
MPLKLKLLICALLVTHTLHAQEVRIGVLGLFHPRHLTLKASSTQALVVQANGKIFVLERSSGQDAASITSSGENLILQVGSQVVRAAAIHATSRSGGAADFVLNVPTKITRQYHAVLEIKAVSGTLVPIVGMDLETAVASAGQAESDPDTPLEALKAQAVATRSYFVAARNRHHDFDFCDTTHCQVLREAPSPDSNASRAAGFTRGLVLTYRDQPIATMFTRSCGGHTRTPQEVGMAHQAYPYFPVVCDYCRRNPSRWNRRLPSAEGADLRQRGEAARLDIDRRLGWETVPSNNFTLHNNAEGALLEGVGQGHGIGLCQRGAKGMAQSGAAFRDILEHYYPNTKLTVIDSSSMGASLLLMPAGQKELTQN